MVDCEEFKRQFKHKVALDYLEIEVFVFNLYHFNYFEFYLIDQYFYGAAEFQVQLISFSLCEFTQELKLELELELELERIVFVSMIAQFHLFFVFPFFPSSSNCLNIL